MSYLKYVEMNKKLASIEKSENETTLEFLYRSLNCSLVNIGCNFHGIDIWVDDEALNTGNYKYINTIKFAESNREEILVGNMLFAASDKEGNTLPLDEEQKEYIENQVSIESVTGAEYLSKMNNNHYNDGFD